jgi:predicted HTH domain antitoxin
LTLVDYREPWYGFSNYSSYQRSCVDTFLPDAPASSDNWAQERHYDKMGVLARNLDMSVIVSEEILTATRMTEAEMRQEIAIMLFQREKLTLAQASRFAGIHRVSFQHLLASRRIPVH